MTLPDSLLIDPCLPYGAGNTVGSLAKGYVKNTGCIREYQLLLEKQRDYKKQSEGIYDNGQ